MRCASFLYTKVHGMRATIDLEGFAADIGRRRKFSRLTASGGAMLGYLPRTPFWIL